MQFPHVWWNDRLFKWLSANAADGPGARRAASGEFSLWHNLNHRSLLPGSQTLLSFLGDPCAARAAQTFDQQHERPWTQLLPRAASRAVVVQAVEQVRGDDRRGGAGRRDAPAARAGATISPDLARSRPISIPPDLARFISRPVSPDPPTGVRRSRAQHPAVEVPEPSAFFISRHGYDRNTHGAYSFFQPGWRDKFFEALTQPLKAAGCGGGGGETVEVEETGEEAREEAGEEAEGRKKKHEVRVRFAGEAMCDDLSGYTHGGYQSGREAAAAYLHEVGKGPDPRKHDELSLCNW